MTYLYLLIGLSMLVAGGTLLVNGSTAVAYKLNVSKIIISIVIVGFGTSTPELVTTLKASFLNSPGIAVGNVVGSNIANILLVLGVAASILPINQLRKTYRRDSIMLIISLLLVAVAAWFGYVNLPIGIIFISSLIIFIVYSYREDKKTYCATKENTDPLCTGTVETETVTTETVETETYSKSVYIYAGVALAGIGLTLFGADMLVKAAIELARNFNVSETLIGLTVVAVGTSLPELAAAIIATIKKESDIVLGNIIGSNIYNVLFILGVSGMIEPVAFPQTIIAFDLPVMGAVSLILIFFIWFGKVMNRFVGVAFLILYVIYVYMSYLAVS